MAHFIIHGGKRLRGRHKPPGNKNAALPMLAACVLTDQPLRLRNVPLIQDVRTMLDILAELGVHITVRGRTVCLCAKTIHSTSLDKALCGKVRSSILFAGPLAARHGSATLFPPGGDVIGRRRLDAHFEGLRQLGIHQSGSDSYRFQRRRLKGTRILLDEASVTATENVVMAACLAPGKTSVFNAACEPHVQDLCRMLNKMGAAITGIGTNCLTIRGVRRLKGADHRVAPDYIDTAGFIAAAALTGGSLTVQDAPRSHLDVIQRGFLKLGLKWRFRDRLLVLPGNQSLRITTDFGSAVPKIEDGTWPAFPSDLMSAAIVLATQAEGTVLFFEKLFESRMYFVDRLIDMGARIVQCDPHRVLVTGPAALHGSHMSSPDIRAGMALLLAALCAKGCSRISNAEIIDRGYENVDLELRELGADIERVE
ncbi:UDP-N-acetylglucosamine 1-carboxyvinyltransferase [Verrucomicrobiota bacterium]